MPGERLGKPDPGARIWSTGHVGSFTRCWLLFHSLGRQQPSKELNSLCCLFPSSLYLVFLETCVYLERLCLVGRLTLANEAGRQGSVDARRAHNNSLRSRERFERQGRATWVPIFQVARKTGWPSRLLKHGASTTEGGRTDKAASRCRPGAHRPCSRANPLPDGPETARLPPPCPPPRTRVHGPKEGKATSPQQPREGREGSQAQPKRHFSLLPPV